MSKYFIGISISELQQWLADDELPILIDRVAYSTKPLHASSSDDELESLFKSLPAFSLDDLAGVLIVEVSGPDNWRADNFPGIRYLALSLVKQFIPLTEDAKTALSVNWSGVIKLSDAIFEREFTYFRIIRKSITSRTAGNLFVDIFINHGPKGFEASSLFAKSLPRALLAAEHRKLDEVEKLCGNRIDELPETWVERTFDDIRRYDNENKLVNLKNIPDNLRGIVIVGVIFSTVEAVKALTDEFRAIYKRLERTAKGHDQSLVVIYADPELSQLKANFNVNQKSSESINLVTLGLFLRWKQAFHDHRSTVNALSIWNDVNSLVGFVDVELVANALWMMGAYLGMENIIPTHRHLHQEKYPALRFSGKEKSLKPVDAWQLEETKYPTEDKLASGSVGDSGATKKPEHESDLEKNTGANQAQQTEQQNKKDAPETKQTESGQECATNGTEQSTEKFNSNDPLSASHTRATPKDTQTHQAQQMDYTVCGPPERNTENVLDSSAPGRCTFKDAKTSAACSNQGVEGIQQTVPSATPVSGAGKTEAGSVESLQETSPAKARKRNVLKNREAKLGTNASNKAAPAPKNPTTSSKTESVISSEPKKPEGSQDEREGESESGKAVQNDLPFSDQ